MLTPIFPAPVNARTFVILRLLGILAGVLAKATGGRMPADQETIRYTGFYGTDDEGQPYLMREVLGGGSGGRPWADGSDTIHVVPDSKNLPVEFTETRFPLLRRVARAGAGLGRRGPAARWAGLSQGDSRAARRRVPVRGGPLDPELLGAEGRAGGQAVSGDGRSGWPDERVLDGLVDDEPIPAGTLVRIDTTGGGGWGDPLEREPDLVALDVRAGQGQRGFGA